MVVIYYGKQYALRDQVAEVLEQMHVPYVELGDEDLDRTLKELIQKEESTACLEGERDIFMYFSDVPVDTIEKIDDALKAKGIHIVHKAVKTDTNLGWKLSDLLDHIHAEASYFQKREKLRTLVSHPDPVLLSTNPKYRDLMVMGFELLEETDVPEKMYDTAIHLIETFPEHA